MGESAFWLHHGSFYWTLRSNQAEDPRPRIVNSSLHSASFHRHRRVITSLVKCFSSVIKSWQSQTKTLSVGNYFTSFAWIVRHEASNLKYFSLWTIRDLARVLKKCSISYHHSNLDWTISKREARTSLFFWLIRNPLVSHCWILLYLKIDLRLSAIAYCFVYTSVYKPNQWLARVIMTAPFKRIILIRSRCLSLVTCQPSSSVEWYWTLIILL